jgi:hypothetical protein
LAKVRPLELKKFPKDIWFHPHGLYLYQDNLQRLLYVINHAYQGGGERIEVFKVTGENYDEISVEYYQSIAPEIFSGLLGILNDLVVIEPGKFYITQFRSFSDCTDGDSQSLKCKFYWVMDMIFLLLRIPYTTVWFGSYNPSIAGKITDVDFFRVSQYEVTVNGITYLPKEKLILVANPTDRVLLVYSINETTHQLTKEASVPSILGIDNLSVNQKTGKIYAGVFNLAEYISFAAEVHSTKQRDTSKSVCGGIYEINLKNTKSPSFILQLYLPGNFYSGISSAIEVDDHYVFGSWYDHGITICKVKK